MPKNKRSNPEKKPTLLDRVAIGFVSAVCFLLTYWLLLGAAMVFPVGFMSVFYSLELIAFLTTLFFIIGFVTLDNHFINMLSPIWDYIHDIIKK